MVETYYPESELQERAKYKADTEFPSSKPIAPHGDVFNTYTVSSVGHLIFFTLLVTDGRSELVALFT